MSKQETTTTETSSTPQKKNRGWIWYFCTVVTLTVIAIVTIIVYNLSQQLTQAELEANRSLWKKNGPESYQMRYVVKRGASRDRDVFEVRVLNGTVVSVTMNSLPLTEKLENRSMDALLADIGRFMEHDAEAGKPWTYTRAMFDSKDGHLLWYVRRVMGSRERVEIEVLEFHRR